MALNSASVSRFRARVNDTLNELFPVVLIIANMEIPANGPGGRSVSDFIDGGESENFRFPFRVDRGATPPGWIPSKGDSLDWKISDTETIPLEIIQTSVRPGEPVWEFTARRRRL
jgi:hypothetical protein